jgi:hypothetical protein
MKSSAQSGQIIVILGLYPANKAQAGTKATNPAGH